MVYYELSDVMVRSMLAGMIILLEQILVAGYAMCSNLT